MNDSSSKTIAIFGAGSGLGASVARKFGREGYRVALVARRAAPLEALTSTLAAEGIQARAFTADLTDIAGIPRLVQTLNDELGGIDVALFSPIPLDFSFIPAVELDAAKLRPLTELFTFSPIELAHALLPTLLARGGAFVYGNGMSSIATMPGLSGVGPAMAAARNYILTLHEETKPRGVYVGAVTIGASIQNSGIRQLMEANGHLMNVPTVSPDDIADDVWSLVTERSRVETVITGHK